MREPGETKLDDEFAVQTDQPLECYGMGCYRERHSWFETVQGNQEK